MTRTKRGLPGLTFHDSGTAFGVYRLPFAVPACFIGPDLFDPLK